jgi:hypothetical protein
VFVYHNDNNILSIPTPDDLPIETSSSASLKRKKKEQIKALIKYT